MCPQQELALGPVSSFDFTIIFSFSFILSLQAEYAKQPRWRQVEQKKKAMLF